MINFTRFQKFEVVFLILLITLNFLLGIWRLTEVPPIEPDELWHGIFSLDVMRFNLVLYHIMTPFLIKPYQGPMAGYILIPSLYLFGQNTFALRIPILAFSVLTSLLFYLFTREFYNIKTALLSLVLLIIMPSYLINSRLSYEFILLTFFCIFSLYLIQRYDKTENKKYLYFLVLTLGLGIISKLNFLFFILSFILSLKIFPIFKRSLEIAKKEMLVMLFLFFFVLYPLIIFNIRDLSFIKNVFDKFPYTTGRSQTNLFNISGNLNLTLFKNFPAFLEGEREFIEINIDHVPLFSITFIFLLLYFISDLIFRRESSDENLKKDLFLFMNFIFIFISTSTLTVSVFHQRSYMLLLPFTILVSSRSFIRLLEHFKNKKCLALLIIPLIFLLVLFYIPKMFAEQEENLCLLKIEEIVDVANDYPKILIDEHIGSNPFKWYFYERGLYDKDISIILEEKYEETIISENNNTLFVFTSFECLDPYSYGDYRLNFLESVNKVNKSVVLEDEILTEGGTLLYSIYRLSE